MSAGCPWSRAARTTTPAAEARALEVDKERAYGEPKEGVAGAIGQAKSLYHRCGGIFGVAAFVDRCMDAWMADPTLNANDRVATWHQRAQRCGFKFLVTQLMGYLCGGPQVYTGLDMAASHKHLAISEEEWGGLLDDRDERPFRRSKNRGREAGCMGIQIGAVCGLVFI